MELKGRLAAIAQKIPVCEILADIGTDHAYIPIYALENELCKRAIAADIRIGPVEIAKRNIGLYNLEKNIEARLGNGLAPIALNECDIVVIAGMGGIMIQDILANDFEKAKKTKMLILQPMNHVEIVRKYLYENGFEIFDEVLVEETIKIYNVITAAWTGNIRNSEDLDCYIGALLLNREDELYERYVQKKLKLLEQKINGLKKAENPDPELVDIIQLRDKVKQLYLKFK